MSRGDEPAPEPTGWRPRLGGLAFAGLLFKLGRAQRDSPDPTIAVSGERVEGLAEAAERLAADGQADDAAIAELRVMAGRHRRALTRAATYIRLGGLYHEDRVLDHANRLLLAAANGVPIEPITPEQDEWFRQVDALTAVPVEQGFATLARSQPALVELEAKVRTTSAEVRRSDGGDLSDTDEDGLWGEILKGLRPLLGPDAESEDALLRSRTAHSVARLHLAKTVGLIDEVEYE